MKEQDSGLYICMSHHFMLLAVPLQSVGGSSMIIFIQKGKLRSADMQNYFYTTATHHGFSRSSVRNIHLFGITCEK